MCKIISISNQKGGVGKTTTSINLGVSLAKLGKKVLLVDLDPQSNLTMALGFLQPDEIEHTIATLIYEEISGVANNQLENDVEENTIFENIYAKVIKSVHDIDFIPANIQLADIENMLFNAMSRENMLKRILKPLRDRYDYILIDCLPSLNILTINALNASDEVIIPVQAQFLSAKGLELLLKSISRVKRNINPRLKIAGVLITMLDKRANFQKDVISIIEEAYGKNIKIFESQIPLSVKVSETQSKGLTIFDEKNNKVAIGYENFAKEYVING